MVDGRRVVGRNARHVVGGRQRRIAGGAHQTTSLHRRREVATAVVTAAAVVHAVRARLLDVTLGRRRVAEAVAHREQVVVAQRFSRLQEERRA